MKFLFFFLAIFVIIQVKCEYYSSTDKLKELFDYESEILSEFSDILREVSEMNDRLYNKIKPWFDEHVAAQEDVDKYVTNPLNAYLLIKRNVYDAKMLEKRVSYVIDEVKMRLEKVKEKTFLHALEVTGAVAGLLRVQRAYHLKSEDLAEGIVDGNVTRKPLSPHDVYLLSCETYKMENEKYFSEKYLRIVAKKISNGEDVDKEISDEDIDEKLKTFQKINIPDPYDETYEVSNHRDAGVEKLITHQVCRGSLTRSPKETKNLFCHYVSFTPFSFIAPFKLEQASIDPYIVLYHDAFYDSEIETLIEIARPKQAKALVGLKVEDSYANDDDRTAQLAWLFDEDHEILKTLNARFEDMTGLTMKDPFAEALQMQNYGVGGQYYAHHDHNSLRYDNNSEDRIATLMLYLSNVEKGGATVFPYIKLRVVPEKGSAVFWYNLKHSGFQDPVTLHSGCPVLLGSKWVANKWIHNIGQEFRRKCEVGQFSMRNDELEMFEKFNAHRYV